MTEDHKLGRMGGLYRVVVVSWLVLYYCSCQAVAALAPLDRQEFLAIDYRFAISRTTDISERETLYLRMIDECPNTELAEEAHWALSNLYLDDFDEPKEDEAREILGLFLKRYPSSRWALQVEDRLSWLRGETRTIP